jgi:hypothetical protein
MYVTVYLAGQMGPKPENAKHLENPTIRWRRIFKEEVAKYQYPHRPSRPDSRNMCPGEWYDHMTILDPTEGEAFDDTATIQEAINSAHYNWKGNLILPKDREFVRQANVVVANLNHYLKEKLILGTIYELAWAYDDPSTTVIVISSYEGNPFSRHPFVRDTANHIVRNEVEAAKVVAWLAGSEPELKDVYKVGYGSEDK